ncbi:MAG: rhomboid family intramembrane serine protease [Bacteroidota bacterium]
MLTIIEEFKNSFKSGSALTRLIIINLLVFASIKIIMLLFFLFNIQNETINQLIRWLAVPASFKILIFRPWTLFTYMFLQEGFLHILFNMLWLYWFGKIFLEYLGEKKLISTYILGGLSGAALYILAFNIFPVFSDILPYSFALGASAAILAIVIAISAFIPNYSLHIMFLGPVKLKYIAIFSVIIDILSIQGDNAGGHLAHLGGALFGYVYIKQYQKGRDLAMGFNSVFDSLVSYFSTKSRIKVVHSSKKRKRQYKQDEDYNVQKAARQHRLDEILDKISKSGYESLTSEEKRILFDISNDSK